MKHKTEIRNDSSVPLRLETVSRALQTALEAAKAPNGVVNVLLTTDDEMRRLNREFRGIDGATDVLTFPAPPSATGEAGDIAVSMSFAQRQAAIRGVGIEDEVAMLVIHGALHLAGYDDEEEGDRSVMLAKMNAIAAQCGIAQDPEWASLPHGGER